MATDLRLKEALPEITEAVVATYTECRHINHLGHRPLPNREVIVEILADLMEILYPGYARRQNLHMGNVEYHVGDLIDGLHDQLTQQIARVLRHEYEEELAGSHTGHDGVDAPRIDSRSSIIQPKSSGLRWSNCATR